MSQEKQKTKRYVKISLIIHGCLFFFLIVGNFISPPAKMIEPTVQIDMVALPDQVKSQDTPALDPSLPVKDQPPPPAKKEPEPEPDEVAIPKPEPVKPKDTKKEADAEKQAKSAIEKLREQMKKEKNEKEKKSQQLVDQRKEDLKRFDEAYRSAIKGNQTNQGTSTTGSMEATLNAYAGHITERLRGNWDLPVWLQGKGLRASVTLYISADGKVARYAITRSSGNEAFDTYVLRTIKISSFAPPPEEMAKGLRNSGIGVDFPL